MHSRAKTPHVTIPNFELLEETLATSEENSISPQNCSSSEITFKPVIRIAKSTESSRDRDNKESRRFFTIKRLVLINSIQDSDPQNNSSGYQNEILSVDLEQEQKKYESMEQVVQWLSTGCNENLCKL